MIRKGQKLCNYIQDLGYGREQVHIKLFHMSDTEFDKVMKMEVDYEIPNTEEGFKKIQEQADIILKQLEQNERK